MPMPAMEAYVGSRPDAGSFTVIGPCPGCSIWTLEYEHTLIGMDSAWQSVQDFRDAIEGVLEEHLDECSGLQEIVAAL